MTAEIKSFTGNTRLDIEPDGVLESAKGELAQVLVVGWDTGDFLYMASSTSKVGEILLLLELAKEKLLKMYQYGDSL